MIRPSKSLLLEEIGVLVRHFGIKQVQAAVAKFSPKVDERREAPRSEGHGQKPAGPSIANTLKSIRESDPEKHYLLSEFLVRLRDRKVLPESEDIRLFAQLVGLKDIHGKSRKDMIPRLMHFLLQLPTPILRVEVQRADDISQEQRREGYSVLTDKLVGYK